ncbi:MAG: beta-lactamase family protein [Spirochaetales bacterium]|nr:beta-lactamase family protein [Spirochaetales bacterium]
MKPCYLRRPALLLLLALAPASPALHAETIPQPSPSLASGVEQALGAFNPPGAIVLFQERGNVRYERHFGFADHAAGRRVDSKTTFRAGAISMFVTAVLVHRLADAAVIDLTAPLENYFGTGFIPDRMTIEGGRVEPRPRNAAALLDGSSGLASRRLRGGLPVAHATARRSLEHVLADISPHFEDPVPGQELESCILGRIVERVTGLDFAAAADTYLFGPADMGTATFRPENARNPALGYELRQQDLTPVEAVYYNATPALSLALSATDMSHLLAFVLGDGAAAAGRLLDRDSARALLSQDQTELLAGSMRNGLIVLVRRNQLVLAAEGTVPGFRSRLLILPAAGRALFVSTNINDRSIGFVERVSEQWLAGQLAD